MAKEKKFRKGSRISDRGLTHDSVSAKTKDEEETCSASINGSIIPRPENVFEACESLETGTNASVLLRIVIAATTERRSFLDMMKLFVAFDPSFDLKYSSSALTL
jgi:hypothetical protein